MGAIYCAPTVAGFRVLKLDSSNMEDVFYTPEDFSFLIATFDTEVNESTVTEIAKMKPQYFVMRDASAANDNVLDNFEQIFKHYSPDAIRKIL